MSIRKPKNLEPEAADLIRDLYKKLQILQKKIWN